VAKAAPADRPRDLVYRALAHQAELYPLLDMAPLESSGFGPRDAAFAHAIYDAAMRRWITLGYLLQQCLSRPFGEVEPMLRGVLLGGAAQLLLLDRVPPHAAINESVSWAKAAVKPAAGGLVNAVLRKIALLVHGPAQEGLPQATARGPWTGARDEVPLSDGTAVKLTRGILPGDAVDRIAIATSHPVYLVRLWAALWGFDQAKYLAAHGLVNPPTILNAAHALTEVPSTVAHAQAGHRVYQGGREELTSLLATRNDVWVQDAASSRAVAGVFDLTPSVVIDACAGQGTKTRQLVAAFPHARIFATDTDPRRMQALRALAQRERRIGIVEPSALTKLFAGGADLVLLDVPCSNTAVLPRRVEARYRFVGAEGVKVGAENQFARLVRLQRAILNDGRALLRPGGAILYSTCSLEPEENEQQAAWACRDGVLRLEREATVRPIGLPGEAGVNYQDGGYSALLRRV